MRKLLFGLLMLCLLVCLSLWASEKTYGNAVVKEVVRVHDGDTFTVNIDKFPDIVGKEISVRVYGIDTPEMTDDRPEIKAKSVKAKEFFEAKLSSAKKIELRNMMRDKYFRILAEVFIDGEDYSEMILAKGLAKKYYGEKKEW